MATSPMALDTANQTEVSSQARDTQYLSIDDCISMALKHNLDIQVQSLASNISQFALSGAYSAYEPTFSIRATKVYSDTPSSGQLNTTYGVVSQSSIGESDNYSPAIKGLLPTGTSYTLSSQWNRNSVQTLTSGAHYLPPTYSGDARIELAQPLLKNAWTDFSRKTIKLSKIGLKTSKATLLMQVMQSITDVKKAYFTLLYNRGNVEANSAAYKLAKQLVAENQTRVKVGSLAPLDEKQSESQAAASLAAMQLAESQLETQENKLKNLITDDFSKWANTTLLPSEKLEVTEKNLDLQESWRLAIAQRPDLEEAKLKVESQNVTLKFDFNQRFPELDLIGSYGRNANRSAVYDALGDIQNGNHSSYYYGASVTIPLGGNQAAKNTYLSDKATLKQLLLQLKQAEQNLLVTVQNDVGNVRSTLQQVYSTRDARIYAEAALDAERKKLENGKSTSFVVLQLISSLTTARVNEIQALANYNINVAQLALDEGDTLAANNIKLDGK